MILIDADILVDLFRGFPSALNWLASLGNQRITAVGFAAMQVMEGCRNLVELRHAHEKLADYEIIWPDAEVMERALKSIRHPAPSLWSRFSGRIDCRNSVWISDTTAYIQCSPLRRLSGPCNGSTLF